MAGFTLNQIKRFEKSGKKSSVRGGVTRTNLQNKRDALVRGKKGKVNYFVWGNRIASYNPKSRNLHVSSAGWETNLTKSRLNKVIPDNKGFISQRKFKWVFNTKKGKRIPFKESLRIKNV